MKIINKTIGILSVVLSLSFIDCKENKKNETVVSSISVLKSSNSRADSSIFFLNQAHCKVINTFLEEYIKESKLDQVLVINECKKWAVEECLDFNISGNINLPKTNEERKKMLTLLTEPLENPYPFLYVYAYPITDTLFNREDRIFMKTQARGKKLNISSCINNPKVILKKKTDSIRNKLCLSTPLFNQDSTKVVLSIIYDAYYISDLGNNFYIGKYNQYVYYVKNKNGEYKKVFATILGEVLAYGNE